MRKLIFMLLLTSIAFGQHYLTNPYVYGDLGLDAQNNTVSGMSAVNKFGYAPSGLQTTATDIWDLADATPTQQIWVAPADSAQTHYIYSSDDLDSSGTSGTGAKTIRVYGLTSWNTAETSEDITMGGTDTAETTNEYVIIHRMKVLTSGDSLINIGNIKAVASGSGTVTAQISAGLGQTEMAIYGVPSTKTAYMPHWYAGINKTAAAAATGSFYLQVNENPDVQLTNFITKSIRGIQSTGTNSGDWFYRPYKKFAGPCIIKVQGIGSAADIDCDAGFDLILVDN